MQNLLEIIDLGKKSYNEAYNIQMDILNKKISDDEHHTLIFVEHPPVFTIGRSGSESNIIIDKKELKKRGIKVHNIDRGGDITYHGPGQLVGYPILKLDYLKKDLHWLLRNYEEVFMRLLKEEYNINAKRLSGLTGVWIDNNKITAIGIGVKKWITCHGFAFNVNTNLEHFNYIIPCGISNKGITSLEKLSNKKIDFEKTKEQVANYFSEVFKMELLRDG